MASEVAKRKQGIPRGQEPVRDADLLPIPPNVLQIRALFPDSVSGWSFSL